MLEKYQIDDELRVVQDQEGHRQLGIRRTVQAPSEALEGHIEAVRDFEQRLEELKARFVDTVKNHKDELNEQIRHAEFFNGNFGKNQWGGNYSFDKVRLHYIQKLDDFRKELRGLELKKAPSIAETVDWARTLIALGVGTLDEAAIDRTLGAVLKHASDHDRAVKELRLRR